MDVLIFNPDSPLTYTAAFLVGVFLHVTLFRVGEWDLWVPQLLLIFTTIYSLLIYGYIFHLPQGSESIWAAISITSKLSLMLIGGIYTSIGTYRILLHPLRRFPGPFLSSVSSVYPVWLIFRKLHMYEEVQQLHRTYGDIVRLGPSELSIANTSALRAIHSAQSPCLKGPWYNIFHPMISVQSERDIKEHSQRRKVWDKGFSSKALRNYEPRVAKYTDLLLSKIEASAGKPMDATLWLNFYGFDVMGDLAFGKSFNMLNGGVAHHYMKLMHTMTVFGTSLGRFPWAFLLTQYIPFVNMAYKKFIKWLKLRVKARIELEPELPDVFSVVLDPYKEKSQPSWQDEMHLIGDANLITVAGSQNKGPGHMALSKVKYLQAVIDEGMRLHPAVPSGVQRMTPPQGMQIDETFIPGNMIVQIPTYTVARDPRCFERPDEFIPERWTSQPELVKDSSAFAPFSMVVAKVMSDNETVTRESVAKSEKDSTLSAQRIRKRELDRRAQRTARVKTKNRIAYLESLVETFRDQDANGANTSLIKQLEGVSAERDGFKRFLQSLDDSIKSHLAGTSATVALNPPNRPRDQGITQHDEPVEEPLCAISQALLEPSSITAPVEAPIESNIPLLDFGSDMDYSIDGSINISATQAERLPELTANPVSRIEQLESSPEADESNLSLASRPVIEGQITNCQPVATPALSSACPCNSTRTRRLSDGTEVSFNIWRAANQILSKPAKRLDDNRECDSISDDIIVRAILHGWESVSKSHQLTPLWRKIRQLDELGFMGCGQVERLGILWIVHLLMPSQHNVKPPNSTPLPKWYKKTTSNHGRHVPGAEYLPWPNVRESFIHSHHRYCQNMFWNLFKEHMRIVWPFEFRDCYTQNVQQGRYQISNVFEETIRNARSWTMERDFFSYFPELRQEIPIFLDIVPPPPRMGAWEHGMESAGRSTEHLDAASFADIEDQFFGLPLYGPPRPTGWNINDYDRSIGYQISYDDLDAIEGSHSRGIL
ncbi:hypothetical protein G7Z17_g1549 [Cylindrodendrum hubeiense]|uniref:Uncharacterized protein n=1 Tax=Cylindrodendrum hubeiense TaxID=595255 RepID=A0A9P5HEQ2_9HYPO|nr:hypothetical protein G7Z17_g1549 [Cylindrodendrum hubeiense]